MTPEQIMLVQSTWDEVEPLADKLGEWFYQRLFQLRPDLRELFGTDEKQQGRLLMSMLGGVVSMLTHVESLLPSVQDLGRRHVRYGVKVEYFAPFRQALYETLAKLLGSGWTPEVKEAWETVFEFLEKTMRKEMDPAG